jgi:hypothetical protein
LLSKSRRRLLIHQPLRLHPRWQHKKQIQTKSLM